MSDLLQDLRYALRTLLRSPAFSAVAILTLALGIGANSAIFSFVDGVLLEPLPYPNPDGLVRVSERPPLGGRNVISTLNFLDWKQENTVFEHLAAIGGSPLTLSGVDEPIQLRGQSVSAAYFEIFGIKPVLGRTFAPGEDQAGRDHVVVLSHQLWQTQFGGDPRVIGRSLTLNGEPHVVIGVLPEGSAFDRTSSQIWRPLAFPPAERARDFHWLTAVARLKPGVTLEQAHAQMDTIAARIARDHPDSNKGWGVTVERYADVLVGPQLRASLYVLLAAVGMLLLVGCANLANMMLARGLAREREAAVRTALGAGRWRLIRQFLTESTLLSVGGGLVGLAVGFMMVAGLRLLIPPAMLPPEASVTMDARVLIFTFALSAVTGIVFGLAPAVHATRLDLTKAMKEGGRGATVDAGRRRLRGAFVVAEVTLAFMLLAGGGLLARSFFELLQVDPGFDETNVITMGVPVRSDRFSDPSQLAGYFRQIIERVDALAGVQAAAVTSSLPLTGGGYGMLFQVAGRAIVDPAHRPACFFKIVSPSYFDALGMRLLKGRALSDRDRHGSPPVTVVNQTMMTRFFAGQNPIGQRVLVQELRMGRELGPDIPWEIVGVVADEKVGDLSGNSPGIYVSTEQSPALGFSLLVRGTVDAATLTQAIGRAVREIDGDQALPDVRTLEQIKDQSTASTRVRTLLLGLFAAVATVLAAIGIYGVMSYSVAQRTHEIGIRAALGADRANLLRLILRSGMTLAGAGLLIGLAGSFGLARLLSGLLFGVSAHDPLTLGGAAVVLGSAALVAGYVPARRAAGTDPVVALRSE